MTLSCSYLSRRLISMKISLTCRMHWVLLLTGWLLTFCASIVLRMSSCFLVFDLKSTKFTILCFISTMAHLFLRQFQFAILVLSFWFSPNFRRSNLFCLSSMLLPHLWSSSHPLVINFDTAKTIGTSFVHSRLDFRNSLYYSLQKTQLNRLQPVLGSN